MNLFAVYDLSVGDGMRPQRIEKCLDELEDLPGNNLKEYSTRCD
jgi:hypothetical protein